MSFAVRHEEEMSWPTIHTTCAAFEQLNCREELQTLPVIWQIPFLGILIPSLMRAFCFRGIKKKAMWHFYLGGAKMGRQRVGNMASGKKHQQNRCLEQFHIFHN